MGCILVEVWLTHFWLFFDMYAVAIINRSDFDRISIIMLKFVMLSGPLFSIEIDCISQNYG